MAFKNDAFLVGMVEVSFGYYFAGLFEYFSLEVPALVVLLFEVACYFAGAYGAVAG